MENEQKTRRRRSRRGGGVWGVIRGFFFALFTLVLIGACTAAILAGIFMKYAEERITPVVQVRMEDYSMNYSSFIYSQNKQTGEWEELQTIHGEENRIWVDIDDMPDALWQAVVAIEDERFFTHHGVDWKRTGGAVVNMFIGMKNTFGGSTITQQMLKNMTKDNAPYVNRKVREIFRALEFEKNYTKKQILEQYLNRIYLGKHCYGVQTAAQFYFGKDVGDLTPAECASLIAITNNPSMYGPKYDITITREDGTTTTPRELNKRRQENILKKMAGGDEGEVRGPATLDDLDSDPETWKPYITQEEYRRYCAEPLNFIDDDSVTAEGILAEAAAAEGADKQEYNSWFVDEVIREVTADLAETRHISKEEAEILIYNGGYRIYTTLDQEIQQTAEAVYLDRTNLKSGSNPDLTSRDGQLIHSGITVMDPYSGAIVAQVGDMGEKVGNLIWSFATDKHQVGSSMKPLTAYAPAIESGAVTPGTAFDDYPVELMGGSHWPKNSPNRYRGFTQVQAGLQHSINTIAVQTLMAGGVPEAYAFATEKLMLDLEPEDMDRSPLGMGGLHRGLSTVEMAAAYCCFANGGIYNEPHTYLRVEDPDGNIVMEKEPESHVAMKETTAYLMTKMLKNAVAAGTGTQARFSGMTIAGKTGTTSDNYDRYFVGYTPYYVAAVWTGYKHNARISYGGGNPAITLWKKVMEPIHESLENMDFNKPAGITSVSLCADSGLRPTEACRADTRGSRVVSVEIAEGTAPAGECTLHVLRDYCTEGQCLATEFCPEECVEQRSYLDHTRTEYGAVTAEDNAYLLSAAEQAMGLEPGATADGTRPTAGCAVHTTALPDPLDPLNPLDPNNPMTPVDPSDPNYPIQDPSDPNIPPSTETPGVTPGDPVEPVTPAEPVEPVTPAEPNPSTGGNAGGGGNQWWQDFWGETG